MVYKSINGLALEYLSNLFSNRDRVTSYSLRDTESKLAIPKPHTNYIKNSFGQGRVRCCGMASKLSRGRQTLCTVLKRLTLANCYPIDSESFAQLQTHGSHGKQTYIVYTLFYLFSFTTFAVANPGEGHGARLLTDFQTKMRPEGPENFFLRLPPPPLSQGLDDRPPSPYLKVWIRHCILHKIPSS